ncbi:hypothetical protein KR50_10130 [Jeotgalibacillus campisalis]|uniref:Transposase n=1 Tax=Jeotgalibacillus campisalis TaxID=220754 RepID=A0A0C2VQF2_9BACL|nr:hypothetical protein KR50_10130 [Jeotgalibacillus campisalis]
MTQSFPIKKPKNPQLERWFFGFAIGSKARGIIPVYLKTMYVKNNLL